MIINLPVGAEFDLSSVANQINEKFGIVVSISQMGRTVYVHSTLTKEQEVDVENIVLGSPVGVQTKVTKKKVTK